MIGLDEAQDLRAKLVSQFEEAEEASNDAREKQERDADYYDGKQLTQQEYNELARRGQPPIVINLIQRKIDFLIGMEAQQRTDPKAYPRTPNDAESAEVVTDALRYVQDNQNYHQLRARTWKDILVPGYGAIKIIVKGMGRPASPMLQQYGFLEGNPDICIKRVPWDRWFFDPHSSEPDFSDARYRGEVVWMDLSEALAIYPDAEEYLRTTMADASKYETFDDKPKWRVWADGRRKRVRIVQTWWKEAGQCYWADFTQAGVLKAGPSPYMGDDGPEDCYVARSAYVDRDNNRYGAVRAMIDPQDEVNKRRSKALHLLTMRQVIRDEGAVNDAEKMKRELARPDGDLVVNPGMRFEIAQNSDLSNGQMALLQHATAELEKMGPNAALQGTTDSESSGRAIQARQQGGIVELGPLLDRLRSLDHEVSRKIWSRCKQYWQAPQFIRVTDRDDAPKFVGLNEPMIDPQTGQMVGMQRKTADLDVDIIVADSPNVATIEQEVWSDLTQLIPTLAQLPPQWAEMSIEASPLPASRKRRMLEILKGGQDGGQQAPPDPAAQAMAQEAQQMRVEGARMAHTTQMRTMEAGAVEKEAKAKEAVLKAAKAERELFQRPQVQVGAS